MHSKEPRDEGALSQKWRPLASIAHEKAHSRQMGLSGGKWVHSSLLAARGNLDNEGFHSDTSY